VVPWRLGRAWSTDKRPPAIEGVCRAIHSKDMNLKTKNRQNMKNPKKQPSSETRSFTSTKTNLIFCGAPQKGPPADNQCQERLSEAKRKNPKTSNQVINTNGSWILVLPGWDLFGPQIAKRSSQLGHPSCGGLGKSIWLLELGISLRPSRLTHNIKSATFRS
jgi:hypothetical protein